MTLNEIDSLPTCLRALRDFDQVFVVDSDSDDGTPEMAADFGATVVPFRWNGRYPKKKQWCLENLPFRNAWVLYVDADEEVTRELAQEIRATVTQGGAREAGYLIRLDLVFMGRRLRYGHKSQKLSLFLHERTRFAPLDDLDAVNSGEVELHYQPRVEGEVRRLASSLIHRDHKSLFHYFARHNKYSDWEAAVRHRGALQTVDESHSRVRKRLKAVFAVLPFKGLIAFLHSYVVLGGALDGRAGLAYALSRGFYYWQIGLKIREIEERRSGHDGPPE